MSTFITISDFQSRLSSRVIELLDIEMQIDGASSEAAGLLRDRLTDKYAISAELAKTGTSRNQSLVSWAVSIALYIMYSRIPDEEIPERVIKDYDDTRHDLEKIQQGKLTCTLALNTDSDGEAITRIRMGSNTPRSHDPYRYP